MEFRFGAVQRCSDDAGGVAIPHPFAQRILLTCLGCAFESRIPDPESRDLPSVAVELEPALQALDASLDLGQVVRFAASRARGLIRVLERLAR